jgi:hypothetical protein
MTQASASLGGSGATEACVQLVASTDVASATVGADVETNPEPSNTVATTTTEYQVAKGPAGTGVSVTSTVATGSDGSQTVTRVGVNMGYSRSKFGAASRVSATTVLNESCTPNR